MYTFKEITYIHLDYKFSCNVFELVAVHHIVEMTVLLNVKP